jgi:hypothetical protein
MCTKKTILIISAVIVTGVAGVLGYAATKPDDFAVSRSITVNASPKKVFAQVNALKKWEAWSPWAKLDPEAVVTFEGPDRGKGATMAWDGNFEVGKGSMKIVESRPNEYVKYELDFIKPFKGTNTSDFTLKREGNTTVITWGMQGKNDYLAKVMSVVMNCEGMIGEKYEEGLNNLKTLVEGS